MGGQAPSSQAPSSQAPSSQSPGEAPTAPAAATLPGASAPGSQAGKAVGSATPPRPGVKAALQHPAAALNAPDDSNPDDSGTTAPSATVAPATPVVGSVDALMTAPPSVDSSAAAALSALAGSRNAYSTAAGAADGDAAASVAGISGIAAAASADAASKAPAAAPAVVALDAQADGLTGLAHGDKHAPAIVDTGAGMGVDAGAAAGLSQLGSSSGATPDATPTPTVRVAASVDSAEFPQELSSRVSWMVDNSINGAKLQVNPPQLGPIELRIQVSGDHAQVWMSSHSMVTRDALQSSTPQLREMLGAQGFSQVSVDISQRSFQERSAYSQPYEQTSTGRSGNVAAAATVSGTTATRTSQGMLDAYA